MLLEKKNSVEIMRQNWLTWLAVTLVLDVLAFLVRSFGWFF